MLSIPALHSEPNYDNGNRNEPWWRLNEVEAYFSNFQSGMPQAGQGRLNHLFLSQRAARQFLELLAVNVLWQWVVIRT